MTKGSTEYRKHTKIQRYPKKNNYKELDKKPVHKLHFCNSHFHVELAAVWRRYLKQNTALSMANSTPVQRGRGLKSR